LARNIARTGKTKTQTLTASQTANVAKMLSDSVGICREHGRNDTRAAYSELINFIGVKLKLANPDACQLELSTIQRLDAIFDASRFGSVVDDHLGHLFTTLEISNSSLGQCLTPTSIADMIVAMTCSDAKAGQTILDPCVGTGLFLISALKVVPPGVQLFGVEIDRLLYRAALVQLTVFTNQRQRNPFFLLNDDSLMHPLLDWSAANLWTPKPLTCPELMQEKTA
jgi:hypothetical protein